MRKIALLVCMIMPLVCMAYYGEESETSVFEVLCYIIGFFYFVLTLVALFKIIRIAKSVDEIKARMGDNENPYYYYLMGDKEKAKEIMTKQMVRELEEKWNRVDSLDMPKWRKRYERIECEIPDNLKNIKFIGDYWDLFGKKEKKE